MFMIIMNSIHMNILNSVHVNILNLSLEALEMWYFEEVLRIFLTCMHISFYLVYPWRIFKSHNIKLNVSFVI